MSMDILHPSPMTNVQLPTKPQKPSCAPRAVHNDKDLDSDIESENDDEDDHPCGGHGKRSLTTRQTVLAGVVRSSHVSLDDAPRKKKQLNAHVDDPASSTCTTSSLTYLEPSTSQQLPRPSSAQTMDR
ncbi:hypothetical protein BC827DRAFT_1386910 [Russula dissimulans]|nr:hypothetical protein BC827DRAFT_1386910 [Russula dissimulans]